MCVSDVVNVHVVLEVGARADDEGGLAVGDAAVDCGDGDGVAGSEDGRGAEGAGGEAGGVGREHDLLGQGLEGQLYLDMCTYYCGIGNRGCRCAVVTEEEQCKGRTRRDFTPKKSSSS